MASPLLRAERSRETGLTGMSNAGPLLVMAKAPGPLCNLSCAYCYYVGKRNLFPAGRDLRMPEHVLESFVRSYIEASPGPLVHFVWHGGEPTLVGIDFYRRAVELQRRYLPSGWTVVNNLQTNGVLLDASWCGFLAEQQFSVGLSLDGPARLHDAYRTDKGGHPTHERVMRALRSLRGAGIEPDILCTLNAMTAARPVEVYRFFLDADVRWVQFLPVVQRTPAGGVSDRSVTPDALGEFLCAVFDEWVRHDVGRIAVQNFMECLLVWSGRPANLCIMAETCGTVLALEHDGSVYSCDHFVDSQHRLGNVLRDGLARLAGAPEQVAFGRAKRDGLPRECRECTVLALCHGGCPKDRFAVSPGGEAQLSYLCAGYRRFYEHTAPLMLRMAGLAYAGRPVGDVMEALRSEETDSEARWRAASRNDPCPCGSGRKYKQCCLGTHRPRYPVPRSSGARAST